MTNPASPDPTPIPSPLADEFARALVAGLAAYHRMTDEEVWAADRAELDRQRRITPFGPPRTGPILPRLRPDGSLADDGGDGADAPVPTATAGGVPAATAKPRRKPRGGGRKKGRGGQAGL